MNTLQYCAHANLTFLKFTNGKIQTAGSRLSLRSRGLILSGSCGKCSRGRLGFCPDDSGRPLQGGQQPHRHHRPCSSYACCLHACTTTGAARKHPRAMCSCGCHWPIPRRPTIGAHLQHERRIQHLGPRKQAWFYSPESGLRVNIHQETQRVNSTNRTFGGKKFIFKI